MNGLDKVFAMGFLIGVVGILVGRKRPEIVLWGDEKARTKAKAFQVYGLVLIVSLGLFSLVAPEEGSVRAIEGTTKIPTKGISRHVQVERWIDRAETVATTKDLCGTAKEVSDAWRNLRKVTKGDKSWNRAALATAKLEQCRLGLIKVVNNAVQAMFVANREKWADTFRSEMLGSGIDVNVALEGEYKDRVIMTNERLKRPMVDMFTRGGDVKEGSLLYNLQQLGMKRATFSDGVGWKVYYEIDELKETKDAYKKIMGPMGLGDVLRLGG